MPDIFMDVIISFYDTVLIYYPNLFFAALFLLLFLFILLILQARKYIDVSGQLKKIKSYRYDLKPHKLSISDYPIILMERLIHKVIRGIGIIEIRTEELVKKIGKEILLDEKN